MAKRLITNAEFLENERYYRRMMELHPDEYSIIVDDEEPEVITKRTTRAWRKKTNADVRDSVLKRDGYCCAECGRTDRLEVHHIHHRADGGTDDPDNLITLCMVCHAEQHKGEPIHRLMMANIERMNKDWISF